MRHVGEKSKLLDINPTISIGTLNMNGHTIQSKDRDFFFKGRDCQTR